MRGISSFTSSARRLSARLWSDRRGAIAPMAAVCITGMFIVTGASVDIARLVTARTALQDAVDSANLALARMPASSTPAQLQAKAQAWITANVVNPDILNVTVATPVRTLGQVQLDVTAKMNTTFASLIGVAQVPVEGHSIVKYGTTHVELALVLDNTGSMNEDGKLAALKSAATSLVNTLSASASVSGDANALKIAVVPFSMAVNVGSGYQNASWITGSMPSAYGASADAVNSSHPDRFSLFSKMSVTWAGCVESRPMPYDVQDTAPSSGTPATMFVPFFAPDEPDAGYYNLPGYGMQQHVSGYDGQHAYSENNYQDDQINDNYKNTNGGVWLTHQNNVAKYKSKPIVDDSIWGNGNKVGPNAGCTVQPIQRLTTNTSTVLNQISNMVAGGDTEIPLGLVWGWHVLSPNAPFADGTAYGTNGTIKVVVLVTDGANTYGSSINPNFSHYTSYAYAANKRIDSGGTASGTASALNSRLSALCNNMKTKNADGTYKINIYAVPLEVTDTNIKSLLQGCTTAAGNYIDVSNASGLEDAFANIAGSISALRVAH